MQLTKIQHISIALINSKYTVRKQITEVIHIFIYVCIHYTLKFYHFINFFLSVEIDITLKYAVLYLNDFFI